MIKFRNKGFTVLELLAAILVISIGVLTAYSVTQRIFAQTIDSANRIQAAYLAKEGIEVVRNLRDNNWINWRDFDFNLNDGFYEIWYADQNLDPCGAPCSFGDLRYFLIDGSGFYNYLADTPTKFKRRITLNHIGVDELNVTVDVFWQKRGQIHSINVQENLYDWK